LEFREAVDFLACDKPFSISYGLAETRKHCMESGIDVYERLCHHNPTRSVLNFDTLAILARNEDGKLDKEKARKLIFLFRPDIEGDITLLNFLKACDKVYRRLRLSRATIVNSNQLDEALGFILNCIFFILMSSVIFLGIYEFDPTQIFVAIGSISLAISFAIGNASSKWFEGVLLVLLRKPYDIGDRIAISDPTVDTCSDGSVTWFVESVNLFSTTVRNAATNEVATYNNGYLAGTRIVNAARSSKASVYVRLTLALMCLMRN
jgi:small-conductance mechanosensitive channel